MAKHECPACKTPNESGDIVCYVCGQPLPLLNLPSAASGLLPPPPMATGIRREIPAHWFLLIIAAAFFGSFFLAQAFYGNGLVSRKRANPPASPTAMIAPAPDAANTVDAPNTNATSNPANAATPAASGVDGTPAPTTASSDSSNGANTGTTAAPAPAGP